MRGGRRDDRAGALGSALRAARAGSGELVPAASRALARAHRPGTASEGPERCSGLDVMRYSADEIHGQFGGAFRKLSSFTEVHQTPGGAEQEFVYCYCRMGE